MSKKQQQRNRPTESTSPIDDQERVRRRAHEIYAARCQENQPGDDLSDWLQAEHEVRNGHATQVTDPNSRPARSIAPA